MVVTKKMIDDLFNVISAILDAVATVPPGATTLTKKQVIVDVLAKTFDSLKADIEQYFISSTAQAEVDFNCGMSQEEAVARAEAILSAAASGNFASEFEKIWSIAGPILTLVEDTAKANLPAGSTPLDVMITVIDAVSAFGNELNIDLPKLTTT